MQSKMNEDFDLAYALSLQADYDKTVSNTTNESDFAVAVALQEKLNRREERLVSTAEPKVVVSEIVDERWELADPNPNIHRLFVEYDDLFFGGRLVASGVAVAWSNRMTLCAGVCSYEGRAGFCSIRLSQPLLKLRPRKNLVETLLHEMIHAYLFVTDNNKDHDGHGPTFLSHMHRINKASGTNISVYHSFHREVSLYRQHWWKCNGPCQEKAPYYGIVKRAMNRPPSSRDPWWAEHQRTCGGTYVKIKEPDKYSKKKEEHPVKNHNCKNLRKMLQIKSKRNNSSGARVDSSSTGVREATAIVPADSLHDSKVKPIPPFDPGIVSSSDESKLFMRKKMLEAAERRRTDNRILETRRTEKRRIDDSSEVNTRPLLKHKKETASEGSHPPCKEKIPDCFIDISSGANQENGSDCILISPDDPDVKNLSVSAATASGAGSLKIAGTSFLKDSGTKSPGAGLKHSSTSFVEDLGSSSVEQILIEDDLSEVHGEDKLTGEEVAEENPNLDYWSVTEFRTCPVCGMSNIPSAIINIHVSLCLDAEEEETQHLDDD